MFSSLRQRLLFWFLILISASFVVIGTTQVHLAVRDKILQATDLVESAYLLLLQDVIAQHDFLSYDTRNEEFYRSGKSHFIDKHNEIKARMRTLLDQAYISHRLPDEVEASALTIQRYLTSIDTVFEDLKLLIKERGYKDYNLEGSMRTHAHVLENLDAIPQEQLLTLRRHEKDYIIRNDSIYVSKFNALIENIKQRNFSKNDSTLFHLNSYQRNFNEMVLLDRKIGIKDNSGLKRSLDEKTQFIENFFRETVDTAKANQQASFRKLNILHLSFAIVLVLVSVAISFLISRTITRPLIDLTQYITRFVDSHFTVEEQTPRARGNDEIGKLTENFTLLKDEVISHLRFFKQKVDERTDALDKANNKLVALNEANSRFVPIEFLHLLGKKSIEEVTPGDQVAREMTVMFTDIRAFTKLSETLSPQENFDFINEYLREIVPHIKKHNGFIDKYIGDTVMALFPDSPDDAIYAALDINKAVDVFNKQRQINGKSSIAIGTGIHTGHLILGTIGNEHRLETTVISDAVNIASRLEGLSKHYQVGVIVSDECLSKVKDQNIFRYRYLDEVMVKGKTKSVHVYEILSRTDDWLKLSYQSEFSTAIKLLKERNIVAAKQILQDIHIHNPEDQVVKNLMNRCDKFLTDGLPVGWDGIEIMHTK